MSVDIFNRKWKLKIETLFNSRILLSRNEFINKMCVKGYDFSNIEIIYDKIVDYLPSSVEVNIYPEDNVLIDYDIDDEDMGDILEECFKILNIKFPNVAMQENFYKIYGPELTVEKLIQFVEYFKIENSK